MTKLPFSAEWDFRSQTTMPQPNGKIGTNTGSWSGATSLIISGVDRNNVNATAAIKAVAPGDTVKLEFRNNPTQTFSTWTATAAPVLAGDGNYYTIAVTNVTSAGTPAAGNIFLVTLTTAGLPLPVPEDSLYWVLAGTDLALLRQNADKLILAGFEPLGSLNASGTAPTYYHAFWRQDAVSRFRRLTA